MKIQNNLSLGKEPWTASYDPGAPYSSHLVDFKERKRPRETHANCWNDPRIVQLSHPISYWTLSSFYDFLTASTCKPLGTICPPVVLTLTLGSPYSGGKQRKRLQVERSRKCNIASCKTSARALATAKASKPMSKNTHISSRQAVIILVAAPNRLEEAAQRRGSRAQLHEHHVNRGRSSLSESKIPVESHKLINNFHARSTYTTIHLANVQLKGDAAACQKPL